jgi:hypothetical protein
MIHTQYFQRRISGADPSTDPRVCQKIPACYCLRFQPAGSNDGPIAGMPPGRYPLTIHRSASGDVIRVYDAETLYFNGGLKPGRGASLAAWVGTLGAGGIPDVWLMTWGDEPGDYIDPVASGVAVGPVPVNGTIGLGIGGGNPVLVGGVKGTSTALMLEMLGALNSGAARVARKGEVLFDSTPVAGGALIDSGILDLQGCDAIEVHADNAAGTVFRLLSMEAYDAAPTLIETILLRKVAWGNPVNGADYAPGKVRGLISENPPGGSSGVHVLYDVTSAANTALDTGALVVEDLDSLHSSSVASGGASQQGVLRVSDDGVATTAAVAAAAALVQDVYLGRGSVIPGGMAGVVVSAQVPRRSRHTTTAAGAGNTVHLIVTGRGRPPGTFAVQMAVPPKARFTLAAGGAANGRLVIIAR